MTSRRLQRLTSDAARYGPRNGAAIVEMRRPVSGRRMSLLTFSLDVSHAARSVEGALTVRARAAPDTKRQRSAAQ